MTMYLHQVIAVQRGAEAQAKADLAEVQRLLAASGDQNPLTGLTRTHTPLTDADIELPAQRRLVQMTTAALATRVADSQARVLNVQLTRMTGNTLAMGTVVLDGVTILRDVPAMFLLFLEEQLRTLITGLLDRLQVLDPAKEWRRDPSLGHGIRASASWQQQSTLKRLVCHVGVQPTEHQPAVVQWRDEDVVTGTLTFTNYSGQLPLEEVQDIRRRATRLLEAVQSAREEANRLEVTQQDVGAAVFQYVFGDLIS
jgi:hypothetical protein